MCYVTDENREKVKNGVERNVTITGRMCYRPRETFPHCIDVDDIKIHPADNELPSFLDLYGAAPNATGDFSSEEFIRRMRSDEYY